MSKGSVPRDANRVPMTSNESILVKKSVTFAAATSGSVAAHVLFTVTGDVIASVFAVCNTVLNDGGAPTISVGTANNVAAILPVSLAKSIAGDEVWVDATLTRAEVGPIPAAQVIANGADIIYNVLVATISSGVLDFYCTYRPLEDGASIIAA